MNPKQISTMSKIEKLQTMEAIWDSLIHENIEIESPDWHGEVLNARKEKIEAGQAEFRSIAELRSKTVR